MLREAIREATADGMSSKAVKQIKKLLKMTNEKQKFIFNEIEDTIIISDRGRNYLPIFAYLDKHKRPFIWIKESVYNSSFAGGWELYDYSRRQDGIEKLITNEFYEQTLALVKGTGTVGKTSVADGGVSEERVLLSVKDALTKEILLREEKSAKETTELLADYSKIPELTKPKQTFEIDELDELDGKLVPGVKFIKTYVSDGGYVVNNFLEISKKADKYISDLLQFLRFSKISLKIDGKSSKEFQRDELNVAVYLIRDAIKKQSITINLIDV
jgi:hypothetical protein